MLKIESKIGKINNSDRIIYEFLADFNNFSSLVPQEKISNWKATEDTCSFTLEGIGETGMKIIEREPHKLIKITGDERNKISFLLWIQLKELAEQNTAIKLTIHAEINPMIQVMVKKPLQNFLDMLVDQLTVHFQNQKPETGSDN